MANEVKFVDTSKECIQMMKKLSRQALMRAGKLVNKQIKEKIPVKTGGLKASVGAKVIFDKDSGIPRLEVGYRNKKQMRKKGYKHYVNATWFEFGTKPHEIKTKQLKNGEKNLTYKLRDYKGVEYGYVVQHPGMTNKNFLKNTVYENINEIDSIIKEELGTLTDYQMEQGMDINIGEDEEID